MDISWNPNISDQLFKSLFLPPADSLPGLVNTQSRLIGLESLDIAGFRIREQGIQTIAESLPNLRKLNLSSSATVNDNSISILISDISKCKDKLEDLDLRGCKWITDTTLETIKSFPNIKRVDVRNGPQITLATINKYVKNNTEFTLEEDRILIRKLTASE